MELSRASVQTLPSNGCFESRQRVLERRPNFGLFIQTSISILRPKCHVTAALTMRELLPAGGLVRLGSPIRGARLTLTKHKPLRYPVMRFVRKVLEDPVSGWETRTRFMRHAKMRSG